MKRIICLVIAILTFSGSVFTAGAIERIYNKSSDGMWEYINCAGAENEIEITWWLNNDNLSICEIPESKDGKTVKAVWGLERSKETPFKIYIPAGLELYYPLSIGDDGYPKTNYVTEFIVSPDNKNYKAVDGVLYSKNGEELVSYPKQSKRKVFKVPDSVISGKLTGAEYLKKVVLSDSAEAVGYMELSGCNNLKTVKLGKNTKAIFDSSFSGCKKLKTVKLNSRLKKIYRYAFYGCKSLKKITIPEKVTKLGSGVFQKCKNLKTITFNPKNAKKLKLKKDTFKGVSKNCKIYVKTQSVAKKIKNAGFKGKVVIK